jgi:hypothetical protein
VSRSVPIPFFPSPPQAYNQAYFAQMVRNFAVYAEQMNTPGPWRATSVTLTTETGNVDRGQMSWSDSEETVDLTMGNGVVQQVGFETYMRCKNDTGSTIPNGTVVGFAGVNAEIKVAPYIADESSNELFFVGMTTFDMEDGVTGPVTVYGKVRDIDTTGGAENWQVGDILYVSPTVAGALTNVRPTAPDVVIVVAAVLQVDATEGEIMVRSTIPMGLDYGSFDSNVDQTLAAVNTATAITVANTLSSNGVSVVSSSRLTMSQSGFYQIDAVLQLTSNNSSAKNVYFWLRKNGTNVAETTRAVTVNINGGFVPISLNYTISLLANDYVELYWAADSTDVVLDALAASAFAPAAPSVLVNINQLQL